MQTLFHISVLLGIIVFGHTVGIHRPDRDRRGILLNGRAFTAGIGQTMRNKLRLNFAKGDILAILAVVIMAVLVMAAYIPGKDASGNSVVQIWKDGKLVRENALDAQARIEISGEYLNIVTIENGRAAISESDCPGADCVHSGWISEPGRSIVCLPNRVEVRITGASEVDFAVG